MTRRVSTTVFLKPEGRAYLQRLAAEKDLSISSAIRLLLSEAVAARTVATPKLRRVA